MSEKLKLMEEMEELVFDCSTISDLEELGAVILEEKDENNGEIVGISYIPVKEGLMTFYFMFDYDNPKIIYEGIDTRLVKDDSEITEKIKQLDLKINKLINLLRFIK